MTEMIDRLVMVVNRAGYCDWRPEVCRAGHCQCKKMAADIVEAMREPTIPMVEAATHLVEGDTAVQYTQNTYEVWRNMIDAALK